MYEIQMITLTL